MAGTGTLKSSDVAVFPAARRASTYDLSSRIFTEKNIVEIVNRLVDRESYVATTLADFGKNNPFEFVVKGYWFKVSSASAIIDALPEYTSATSVYAVITLDTGTTYEELSGQDDNNFYYGVQFTTEYNSSWETAKNIAYLKLFESSNGTTITADNMAIPAESLVVFNEDSLEIDMDGGIID